jgi:hypothetical protein
MLEEKKWRFACLIAKKMEIGRRRSGLKLSRIPLQCSSPPFRWTHTFAATNREESVVIPPLSTLNYSSSYALLDADHASRGSPHPGEVVRLTVQFSGDLEPSKKQKNMSSPGDLPTVFVQAAFEAQSGRDQFVDSLFVVRDEPACTSESVRAEESATQVAAGIPNIIYRFD